LVKIYGLTDFSIKGIIWAPPGLLVVVIAGGAWYWFKVFQKLTLVVEVKTTETENQEPVQKLNSFYYSAKVKDSVGLFMYNPNEGTSKQIALSIASPENILGATDKVAYVLSSDSVDGFAIQEYDLSTKKFKVLIKPISSKYHIPRFLLSPDYENIVYSEICYSECDSKYGAEYSHTVTKIFNIADGSSKILYENRAPQYTFYKVVDKWVGQDQILLGGYCECDGLILHFLKDLRIANRRTVPLSGNRDAEKSLGVAMFFPLF
jgi:hypothetical protein